MTDEVDAAEDDIAAWNRIASEYSDQVEGPSNPIWQMLAPFVWTQLGDLAGKRVLDIGCGHGWLARELVQRGASVVGVDGSEELIRRARALVPDAEFDVHDLQRGLPPSTGSFDAAIANMVLMDIPSLDALLADLHRALEPAGNLVFTMQHPCFFSHERDQDPETGQRYRKVTGYLTHETRWITSFGGHRHYHRPLSWYFERLSRHGFTITGMDEPLLIPMDGRSSDQWEEFHEWNATIPAFIALSARVACSDR